MNYSQATQLVAKKGNYTLLFKVIPYAYILLLITNFFLIFIDRKTGENGLLTFRIVTAILLSLGVFYFEKTRNIRKGTILIYELSLAICLPVCQSIGLFNNGSIWYLYSAVIVGGLFYGLLSGYFIVPVLASPALYYLSYHVSEILPHHHVSNSFMVSPGIFIVTWFSAIAASAVRVGFDVFYYLNVALQEQALQLESVKKLKETAEQKLLLEKELSKLKRAETLGLYAGGIAHDFNNMLTIIAGQMMFLRRTSIDECERTSIESIMQAVKKTSGLIKKLLFFTGQHESNGQVFSLHEIIDTSIELLRHGTDKNIEFASTILREKDHIKGDYTLLQTSLIGFLFALLKVSNSKSPLYINLTSIDEYIPVQSSTIRLGIASVDTVATLTIFGEQDTMLHWQNMEAFQELLGVIRSMNGKLFTENNLKKFVVQITIPLKMSQIQTPFKNKPGTIDTKSILVVDDDMLVLKSIEDVLVNAGYNVFSYQDPVQAIKLFKQNYTKIGLVILDMRMPKITGKKFFFKCKKIDPLVKTLIISGYCSDSDVQEMIDLGVIGYIEKPYTEEDLSSQVASYMNHV